MRFWNISLCLGAAFLVAGCSQDVCEDDDCISKAYVHKYGVRVRPDYWADRGENGQVISYMRDGVVISQTYAGGELHGESSYTYPGSDRVAKTEIYENNQRMRQDLFYESGKPKEAWEWTGPDCYTVTCWYECGTPRCVENFSDGRLISGEYFTKNHHRDSWVYNGSGERFTRDCNGCFLSQDDFHGGEMVKRTYYYPTKGPREIICFQNGCQHGERKTFYPDGMPNATESWENGRQNGVTVIFQRGEKYAEVPYLDGKKNGIEKRFYDGANISQEITWFDGQMHGPTYTYTGDATQVDWFYKGRMTSQANFESYYKNPLSVCETGFY